MSLSETADLLTYQLTVALRLLLAGNGNKVLRVNSGGDGFQVTDVTTTQSANKIAMTGSNGKVDPLVSDADGTTSGKVQLAGDLGGTATAPTVVTATTSVAGKVLLAPNGGTTAGQAVQANDSRLSGSGGSLGASAAVTAYGGAFDGDVTFDTGGATPTGWTKSGSTYTRTGGDTQYKVVTFAQDNILLDFAGFVSRCRSWNPTAANGIGVINSGTNASGSTGGAGAAPAAIATSSAGATFYGGSGGGNGGNNSAGSAGTSIPAGGGYGGGQGGRGGSASVTNVATIRTGGNGGGGTATAAKAWYYGNFWSMIAGGLLAWRNGTALLQIAGATGGGGGGGTSNAGGSIGGAGGGGGGVLMFAAETAAFGTGCYFRAAGATGSNGAATGAADVDAGGGGGGGRIAVVIGAITGSSLPAFQAPGGNGGNGAVSGTGYYAEGGSGGNGGIIEVYVGTNNVGGTPSSDVSGGSVGTSAGTVGGTGYVAPTAGTAGTFTFGSGA